MADFEKRSYWHGRFSHETAFEWLASSAAFMNLLAPHLDNLSRSARILHLGSGTSDLHNHLRQAGFVDVTNVDYEPLALERGRKLERDQFGDVRMHYVAADATRLDLRDRYQVAIDKSTADAVACGGTDAMVSMAQGIRRALQHGGFWISLSYSPSRFEGVDSLFEVVVVGRIPTPKSRITDPDIFHWCYLLRPKDVASEYWDGTRTGRSERT